MIPRHWKLAVVMVLGSAVVVGIVYCRSSDSTWLNNVSLTVTTIGALLTIYIFSWAIREGDRNKTEMHDRFDQLAEYFEQQDDPDAAAVVREEAARATVPGHREVRRNSAVAYEVKVQAVLQDLLGAPRVRRATHDAGFDLWLQVDQQRRAAIAVQYTTSGKVPNLWVRSLGHARIERPNTSKVLISNGNPTSNAVEDATKRSINIVVWSGEDPQELKSQLMAVLGI